MEANKDPKLFYLQSKIYRAYEAIEIDYDAKGLKPKDSGSDDSDHSGPQRRVEQ